MPVTMKEIAKIAGVSQPAVSAALSSKGTTKVSEEMRRKILRIAEELNYMPNNAAQRLRGRATRTIGIFGVPYVSILTQALMLDISLELEKLNYNLLTCYGDGEDAAVSAVRELVGKGIDGLIITTEFNLLKHFKSPPVPYVFCPCCQTEGFDITIDHAAGTEMVFELLYDKGYRRFGYVALYPDDLKEGHPNREKYNGILNGLRRHRLEYDSEMVIFLSCYDGDTEKIVERIRSLMPEVLFCQNDYLASRLIMPLMRAGIRIPEDLILIGYDGLTLCDIVAVPLATIIQPNQLFADQIVKLLMKRIHDKQLDMKPEGRLIKPYFYPSESCGMSNVRLNKLKFASDTFSTLELNWKLYNNKKQKEEKQ